MLKLIHPIVCVAAIAFLSVGCEEKKTEAQQSEAQQKAQRDARKQQAAKYYQELVEKYPDTPFAAQARERLQAIGPVATPGAKPAGGGAAKAAAPAGETAQK